MPTPRVYRALGQRLYPYRWWFFAGFSAVVLILFSIVGGSGGADRDRIFGSGPGLVFYSLGPWVSNWCLGLWWVCVMFPPAGQPNWRARRSEWPRPGQLLTSDWLLSCFATLLLAEPIIDVLIFH